MAIFALYPKSVFVPLLMLTMNGRLHYIMLSLLAAVVYSGLFYAKNK